MTEGRPARILMVEDNEGDVILALRSLQAAGLSNEIQVVGDGVEALEFLRSQGAHAGAPRPDLILLDMNLPRLDGRGFLETVKGDPQLASIPVVALLSSRGDRGAALSGDARADAFIVKPVTLASLSEIARDLAGLRLTLMKTSPPGP